MHMSPTTGPFHFNSFAMNFAYYYKNIQTPSIMQFGGVDIWL